MPFDFSASDFASIVATTAYVDKSLMIRDVYNASSRVLITAPRRFGKSTNLDMIKRFFEIEVDPRGIANPVHTTNNYKLFKDYNLEICKDIDFFNEHFGKYPVVYIDFKPFSSFHLYKKNVDAIGIITKNAFQQHSYILQHSLKNQVFSEVTGFDENDFRKCVSGIATDELLYKVNLADSFNHLSTILKRFFGKKVFVLIDNYDVFLDSPLFKNNTNKLFKSNTNKLFKNNTNKLFKNNTNKENEEKLVTFVESSIGQLLGNVTCVERVLITGVIPVIFEGFLSNNIEFYRFLDSHPFTKYYGLTSAEVDTVLSKVIESDEERREVKNTINDYYNAHETCKRNIRVYSVWSVLQYVCSRTARNYWCERSCISMFKECFKIEPIQQKLEKLLLGNELELDISQPLTMADVLKVKSLITHHVGHVDDNDKYQLVQGVLFHLIYHSGYLSVVRELGMGVVCVNIPSKEIKYKFAKDMFYSNSKCYYSTHVNDILWHLDEFRRDSTDLWQRHLGNNTFQKLYCNIYYWHRNNNVQFTRIRECLFMKLVIKTNYRPIICRKLGSDGPTAVLLKNKHQIAICVTYDGCESAESVHQKVTNDADGEHMFAEFSGIRGKVIIAIGYYESKVKMAYSYYFKTGDNLRDVRILPLLET